MSEGLTLVCVVSVFVLCRQEGVKKGLRFKVGMAAMPHPFKRADGVGANRRWVASITTQPQAGRQGEKEGRTETLSLQWRAVCRLCAVLVGVLWYLESCVSMHIGGVWELTDPCFSVGCVAVGVGTTAPWRCVTTTA